MSSNINDKRNDETNSSPQTEGPWPLTAMQLSMVFQTVHGKTPGNYIQQLICRSDHNVTHDSLVRAAAILSERHPALRLQFDWDRGEPAQVVVAKVTVPLEVRQWKSRQTFAAFLHEDRIRGLDLSRAPLLRLTVFEAAPERTLFVLTFHHALMDGRSRVKVMRELFQLLRDPDQTSNSLGPAPIPYPRYLEWMASKDHSPSRPFWTGYLQNLPELGHLPLPEGNVQVGTPGIRKSTIADSAPLRALAATCGCSLNNIVQAAWGIVLARYQGQRESVFGTTRACRHSALDGAAQEMVGLLINTVPIRVQIPTSATVRTVLNVLKQLQIDLREHENTSFAEMFAAAGLPAGAPLFNAYLMFEDLGTRTTTQFPGWSYELCEQTEQLSLSATASSRIELKLEYERSLYTDSSMAKMLRDFTTVLAEMAESPDVLVDSLPAFTPSMLLNAGAEPAFDNVLQAVAYWDKTTPNHPAVVSKDGVLTYAELEQLANRTAHTLIARGIQPGSRIGVSIPRSANLIVALLAIWKAGCTYLPIDSRYPDGLRAYMQDDAGVTLVLHELPESEGMPETSPSITLAQSAAYVIYTSGSTGKPKGVLVSHGSLANLCSAMSHEFKMSPSDRMLQGSTISFDISVEEIFTTLWSGATIIPAGAGVMSSPSDFAQFVKRKSCTILDLPTAFWHEMVAAIRDLGHSLPESIRLVVVGGERVLPGVFAAWRALPETSRIRWLNTYGPTEATVTATVYEPTGEPIAGSLPIGKPIRGVNAYILDEFFRPTPQEVSGELYLGGAGVADGYLNAPDLTASRFLSDPFRKRGRMYRTGDRARLLSDGNIEFLGRRDFQVKFRGYRIELGELEVAAESHPGVQQAVAHVRNSDSLVLFVAPRSGQTFEPASLRDWLAGRLVEWMVPTAIVPLEKFPLTSAGKIDRKALTNITVQDSEAPKDVEPASEMERQLIGVWESLFQRSHIGPNDNFFGLGGHSLLAMRMLVHAEKLAGRKVSFADLSQAPTIRQFARVLGGGEHHKLPKCLVQLRECPNGVPLFCFHGVGGVVHWYNDLASLITDRPMIGVQSVEGEELPNSIEAMSSLYLEAIRKVQPHGPYFFMGHSMGGILAYHCAVLCSQIGEEVAFAASLDGWYRAADNPSSLVKVARVLRCFWRLDLAEKRQFIEEKMTWLHAERSQRNRRAAEGIATETWDEIKANNIQLARRYQGPAYDGEFHVFRAHQRPASEDPDPGLGWGRVARKVVAEEVPGSHFTVLTPPNVAVLAEKLRRLLPR